MAARMPNPDAVPMVDRGGHASPPWVRWLQSLTGEVTTAATPAPAPTPSPSPAPADPGPTTAGLISALDGRIDGLEQAPPPPSDAPLSARIEALESDPTPSALAARVAALERAVNDLQQGTMP